jgi:hypothetical protein
VAFSRILPRPKPVLSLAVAFSPILPKPNPVFFAVPALISACGSSGFQSLDYFFNYNCYSLFAFGSKIISLLSRG